jgi:PadR family transcriptional regulator PadR
MNKELLKGHLPVLVLGLIAERPMHGYAVCQAVREKGGRALVLGEGTIYPLLYRLARRGYVASRWETGENGKQRKVYRITKSGARLIAAHRTDWNLLSSLFKDFMGEGWVTP